MREKNTLQVVRPKFTQLALVPPPKEDEKCRTCSDANFNRPIDPSRGKVAMSRRVLKLGLRFQPTRRSLWQGSRQRTGEPPFSGANGGSNKTSLSSTGGRQKSSAIRAWSAVAGVETRLYSPCSLLSGRLCTPLDQSALEPATGRWEALLAVALLSWWAGLQSRPTSRSGESTARIDSG